MNATRRSLCCSVACVQGSLSPIKRPAASHVLLLAGRRTAYVGARIPPPAVVACERLWSDTEWPAYIGRRVPPLTGVARQGLWPDPERSADLPGGVPPLAVGAVGLADRRCRDRHGCHRRERHHDGGNKTANEYLHLRTFPSWYMHYRTEPGHRGQDHRGKLRTVCSPASFGRRVGARETRNGFPVTSSLRAPVRPRRRAWPRPVWRSNRRARRCGRGPCATPRRASAPARPRDRRSPSCHTPAAR